MSIMVTTKNVLHFLSSSLHLWFEKFEKLISLVVNCMNILKPLKSIAFVLFNIYIYTYYICILIIKGIHIKYV